MLVPVVVDVESDGPTPTNFSIVCFGAVAILNDRQFKTFYGKTAPQTNDYNPDALAISGFTREQHEDFPLPQTTMYDFTQWLKSLPGRPQFWSDNPAFDWQFINAYLWDYTNANLFGYSARRIGDLYSGMTGNLAARWKHLRITKHDHNPVNDALGNAEALVKIFDLMKGK